MEIQGNNMDLYYFLEIEEDIIAAESNTPERVLEDYFRGKGIGAPDSSQEQHDWAQNLESNVYNEGYFLVVSKLGEPQCRLIFNWIWSLSAPAMLGPLGLG